MLDVPEIVKQRCRGDNTGAETARSLELSFFNGGVDTLYPSNDTFPAENLYPADAGSPWLTIGMDKISAGTLSLTESLCSGSSIVWGSCEAAKFSLTVADTEEEMVSKEFSVTLSIGDYRMAYGIYIVDSVVRQADRRKRKITAYDRMVKFDVDVADWYNAMYPTDDTRHTIRELRDSLCGHIGVPQQYTSLPNDGMVVGRTISPQNLSGRKVLKAICEVNGVFGHFDRTGTLTYAMLQDTGLYPDETLYPGDDLYPQSGWAAAEDLDHYRSITYEDYLVDGIGQVQVRQEAGDIGAVVGSGGSLYVVEGNFLAYGLGSSDLTKLAWSLYDMIAGKSYRPAKITTYAMPWIEVGDGIRAATRDTEIATYVLSRTMSGIQAMMDVVEAKGAKTQKQGFGIKDDITQLKGRTAVLAKNVDEVSATVSDLEKDTTSQLKVVSDQISAEVKRATGQEEELAGSLRVMAGEIEAKVSQGDLVAKINLEVNKAGSVITMEAGHFVFKGANFFVNEDGSGGAANGNLTWDTGGKLTAVGIELKGTANTSSIGCSVLSAQSANIDGLTVNGRCELPDVMTRNINANRIRCTQIYSSTAGQWWSDGRLKKDIVGIPAELCRKIVCGLRPVSFRYRVDGTESVGFIAQEVQALMEKEGASLPLVGWFEGYLSIPYAVYTAILAGAFQAQQEQIDRLEKMINQIMNQKGSGGNGNTDPGSKGTD